MSAATSDGLTAALVKASEALGIAPNPFQSELISHGLDRQEVSRVHQFYFATWRLNATQYESSNQQQRDAQDGYLRRNYSRGVGRLFWETSPMGWQGTNPFTTHVNQLIAEADQQQEAQQ